MVIRHIGFQRNAAAILQNHGDLMAMRFQSQSLDNARARQALRHFGNAFRYSPGAVLPVWYKVAQALGGVLGLEKAFLSYRRTRRKYQHHEQQLQVDASGVHW